MNLIKHKVNFKALDALRGIAALYVVINHSRGHLKMGGSQLIEILPLAQWSILTKIEYGLLKLTSVGTEFVILFFVLSGFSIRHSLSNNEGLNSIFGFYKRRFIRLYPPFLLALVWAFVVYWLLSIFNNQYVEDEYSVFTSFEVGMKNLLYINSGAFIPQFWSLIHEVFFYLIAPFCLLNKKTQNGYLILSVILFVVGIFIDPIFVRSSVLYKFIFHYNIYFVFGVMVYEFQDTLTSVSLLNWSKLRLLLLLIGLPLVIVLKMKLGGDSRLIYLVVSFLSMGLIINTFSNERFYTMFYKLGEWSYTLYVTHIASLYILVLIAMNTGFIEQRNSQSSYFWMIGVLFSILCSYVLYNIGEKPTKAILQKIRSSK